MYNPKFQINLLKIFNQAFAGTNPELKDKLRETLQNKQFRDIYSKEVINVIIAKTLDGVDKNGKEFAPYSKAYIKSDTFKIYKKSRNVNLELTGEMLSSLISIDNRNSITIELIGELNKAKAHGHVFGLRLSGGGRVRRDFLGLTDPELEKLMKQTVLNFRNEEFKAMVADLDNKNAIELNAQVGNQPEANAGLSANSIINRIFNVGR